VKETIAFHKEKLMHPSYYTCSSLMLPATVQPAVLVALEGA
jgi:hypothetical protein